MLKGSIVALITPFKNNMLDEAAYSRLIHYHIENGTNGVVPGGTTGESPTLTHNEHKKIIEIAVKECGGKIPVYLAQDQTQLKKLSSYQNLLKKRVRMLYL